MFRNECLLCHSRTLSEVANLGMHPMADTYIPASRLSEPDRIYPLIVDLCEPCGQLQLRVVTDPNERYAETDYSYTSANSATSRRHWTEYAQEVSQLTGLRPGETVLEVGSNDGFLCEAFATLGYRAFGVDGSPAMARLAAERNIDTLVGLFGTAVVEELAERLPGGARLIVANNVFNHANDPVDFAKAAARLLAPTGTFVFELPYWANLVTQGTFDQIYHEHVTYFTVTYAANLFSQLDMVLVGVDEVDYHGGSIRVFVRHAAHAAPVSASLAQAVSTLSAREHSLGLFTPDTYATFRADMVRRRDRFLGRLFRLRSDGTPIVCVGAAAKANTFLNYYRLDASVVDFITDASPLKIGKYTPGTRIPIRDDAALRTCPEAHAILTSWNIAAALRDRLAAINPRIQYLSPYEGEQQS